MPTVSDSDTLIGIEATAQKLRVSVRTVYRMQADGLLEPVYVGSPRGPRARRRYRLADVEALAGTAAAAAS